MDISKENYVPTKSGASVLFAFYPVTHPPPSQPRPPQHDMELSDRSLLQPIPPSKRAMPRSCQKASTTRIVNNANEFLHKELAQIIEE